MCIKQFSLKILPKEIYYDHVLRIRPQKLSNVRSYVHHKRKNIYSNGPIGIKNQSFKEHKIIRKIYTVYSSVFG